MEHPQRFQNLEKLSPQVKELYEAVGIFLNDLGEPALLFDALCMDCPIVGASPGFCSLTGYSLDDTLGQNSQMLLKGVPTAAVSKSNQKDMDDFFSMCRTQGLLNIAEAGYFQANSRKDGSHFVNLFVLGLTKIGPHICILGVQMCMGEGILVRVDRARERIEESRQVFKSVRRHLINSHYCRTNYVSEAPTLDSLPGFLNPFRRQVTGQPDFAFYARRLQSRSLVMNNGYTAVRREPAEIANNCMLFGDRPVRHTAEGLSFQVQVDQLVDSFQGLPLLGFTKRRPQDAHDLYPEVSRCCGSSVLIGACGEAFARDKPDHFPMKFKKPPSDELQQWTLDVGQPQRTLRAPISLQRDDRLRCVYLWNGRLELEVNEEVVLGFDLGRPIDAEAEYYAVVDVCFSAYSLTLVPPLSQPPLEFSAQVSPESDLSYESEDEAIRSDMAFVCRLSAPNGADTDTTAETQEAEPRDVKLQVSAKVNEILIKQSIKVAVKACEFMVTIANPREKDCPLIAVSKEFMDMTGYEHSDVMGRNCRFLNHGCYMDPEDLQNLRRSIETGDPFTAVLENRKKNGDPFLNLLDLRGLTVATHPETGECLWFLVGVQADVTDLADPEVPADHWNELQAVATSIRSNIASEIAKMAVDGAHQEANNIGSWDLLRMPVWMGEQTQAGQTAAEIAKAASVKMDVEPTSPATKAQQAESRAEDSPKAQPISKSNESASPTHLNENGMAVANAFMLGMLVSAVVLGSTWLLQRRRNNSA